MTVKEAAVAIKSGIIDYYDTREAAAITERLMEALTGYRRVDRILHDREVLTMHQLAGLKTAIRYLKLKMPVQYILGYSYFGDLKLKVNNQVLIPRPETEELVDWVKETWEADQKNTRGQLIDLCTGSGCIALALKKALPQVSIQGFDLSDGALGVARHNSRLTELEVDFFKMDVLDKKQTSQLPLVDCIVSNPPYIHVEEKEQMEAHVLDYEPLMALFPLQDTDATIFYRHIATLAAEKLHPGGYLFFELNPLYADEIQDAVKRAGLSKVEIRKDMQGLERMMKAVK